LDADSSQNRAGRRRQEREAAKQDQEDYGPAAPRVFKECPVCGCPTRFTIEAMKGDLQLENILGKEPALGSLEYVYDTPTHTVRLIVVVDSCQKCGAIITLARDKIKTPNIEMPPGHGGRIIGTG
jgi:hypothetical protein